ncbi:MAG: hypothetical protein LBU06_05765 [Desulfovibrio sp.]|jgi:hypothetical protein|nr:hypothetical protein [Desulfovibrio sp.]
MSEDVSGLPGEAGNAGENSGSGAEGGAKGQDGPTLLGAPEEPGADGEGAGGEGGSDKSGDGTGAKDNPDDPAASVPGRPEDYKLEFAPETRVDATLLEAFQKTAHELGLTLGQSRKLAALYEGHAARMGDAAEKAQLEALDKAQADWEAEIKSDMNFAADFAHARAALRQFGSPELAGVMNQTRIGSFPAFFKFVAAVGKALAEPEFKGAGGSRGDLPLRDRLWPDMK